MKSVHNDIVLLFQDQTFEMLINISEIKQTYKLEMTLNTNIFFYNMQMITKLLLLNCLHLYGTRRRVALVRITFSLVE